MRYLALVALVALALASPSRCSAASSTKAQEKAAKKACASGDFRTGVDILAGLYVDTNDLTHVYNQGRCYEQNHQWSSAIDRFREYLRKSPNATASDRAEVDKHISDCEALRAQEEPGPGRAPTPQPPAPTPPESVPPPIARENAVVEQATTTEGSRGSGLRVTGVALASTGLAAAVVGFVLNLKANGLADDFNRTQLPATRSRQSSYKTGSMICYGAGAGMLVTGVVLYLVGRSSAIGASSRISFFPTLTTTELSLGLGRTF